MLDLIGEKNTWLVIFRYALEIIYTEQWIKFVMMI